MEKNFSQWKRKLRRAVILQSLLFGLALGVLCGAGVVLAQKLAASTPTLWLCLVIGVGAAILGAGAMLLLRLPTEKTMARQLDKKLTLGEKVQTMVAFRGEESTMLGIQREQTEGVLAAVSPRQLRSRRAWMHGILPLIACAVLCCAILVPVQTAGVGPTDGPSDQPEPWALSEWHIISVRALIDRVRGSDMVEPTRSEAAGRLESMLTALESVKTKDQMKKTVLDTMVRLDAAVDAVNTYTPIIRALRASSDGRVTRFASALGTPADPILEGQYQALRASFDKESLGEELPAFGAALMQAVNASMTDREDALYVSLAAFATALQEFVVSESETETALSRVFESGAEAMSLALQQQFVNRKVSDETITELSKIFDIPVAEWPEELTAADSEEAVTRPGESETPEENDEIISGGGLGSGEVNYGSDDAVYDPESDSHVKYGEVIDHYDGKKTSELQDRPLTEALREWIDAYFGSLYYNEEK